MDLNIKLRWMVKRRQINSLMVTAMAAERGLSMMDAKRLLQSKDTKPVLQVWVPVEKDGWSAYQWVDVPTVVFPVDED